MISADTTTTPWADVTYPMGTLGRRVRRDDGTTVDGVSFSPRQQTIADYTSGTRSGQFRQIQLHSNARHTSTKTG